MQFPIESPAPLSARRRHATFLSASVVLLFPVFAAACVQSILDPSCGPEVRAEFSQADLIDSTSRDVGDATVSVGETRGAPQPYSVFVLLMGPRGAAGGPLRGHVTGVQLHNAGGDALLAVPVLPPPSAGDEIAGAATIPVQSATQFATLRSALLAGTLRIQVTTDTSVHVQSPVILPATASRPFSRARCS